MPREAQEWYKQESFSLWKGKNDKAFQKEMVELSSKCPISKTIGKWKKCVKLLDTKKSNTNIGLDLFCQDHIIVKLECSKGLDHTKLNQLIYYYDCAKKKHPNNKEELIRYFINLCKKEGRGEIKSSYEALNGYFTNEVAKKYEEELRNKIDIYDNI